MPVLKLKQSMLTTLKCPAGKRRIEYCDSEVPGLYLLVGDTDTRTLFHRYKDPGMHKTVHRKVGRISDISLADARTQVLLWKAELSSPSGNAVEATSAKRKEDMTLSDFWTDYYFPLAKQTKRSWKRDEQLWRIRIEPKFGSQKLIDIERHEIQLFHGNLLKENLSPASCDLHAALLKRMFSMCQEYSLLDKNPAARMKLFHPDNRVEHYLDNAQLGKLLEVLRTDSHRDVCNICLFLLATGARLNEALSATWDQIDTDNRVWRIPAKNTKSARTRSVPLNDTAIEVIEQLETKGKYSHLYVNPRTKKNYVNISASWYELRSKAGLPYLRLHDLRHGAASNLINSGASLAIVQSILGHSSPVITQQRYCHLSMQSLHDASANAAALIQRASQSVKPEVEVPEEKISEAS